MCNRKERQKIMCYRERNLLKRREKIMIKKICIIFIFVLLIFNISKVEATTQTENIEKLNEQERNSSLRVFVVENATQERLANVTMRVEEIESGYYGYYTTEEDGIAYINKIASGEAKITIVEVPDEYILNDTEYIIKIREDKNEAYAIGLNHKTGELLIKSEPNTVLYVYDEEGVLKSEHWIGEEKQIYLSFIDTGKYTLNQRRIINGQQEDVKTLEFVIKENELCEIDLLEQVEEIEPDESENEDKENDETEDNENVDKVDEDTNKPEIDNEENENEEETKDDEVDDNTENSEEIKDNETEEKTDNEQEIIDGNDNKEENKDKNDNTQEDTENNTKEEGEDNPEESIENKIDENIENSKEETEEIKENIDNKLETNEKNEEIEEITKEEKIEESTTKNEVEEEKNIENQEITEENLKENTKENVIEDVKNVSTSKNINLKKLPRTGDDYFIIKLIAINLLILMIFISAIILKKKKTDYKNSLLHQELKNNTN